MRLLFEHHELIAILKLADAMMNADGIAEDIEMTILSIEMARLGVKSEEQLLSLYKEAKTINELDCLAIICNFSSEKKKYIAAFLLAIMASDDNIDKTEMELWTFVSAICELPEMGVQEAFEILKKS